MLAFHVTIHARPTAATDGPEVEFGGRRFRTLAAPREALATPFEITFEQAGAALEALPRLFFEPDGSFVWTSAAGEPRWQVDGNLFDRADRLLFVDLKGTCPASEFDRLLHAFGWPQTPLMFQLVREAALLDEPEFRRWAACRTLSL